MLRHKRRDARGRGVRFVLGKKIKIKVEDAVGWGGGRCAVLTASTGLQASPGSGHMEVLCSAVTEWGHIAELRDGAAL